MANCASCGQMILFGGVKHGSLRFCNKRCYDAAGYLQVAEQLPDDVVDEALTDFHQSNCPCCGGPGPVDIHFSHRVMSFVVLTQFQTIPKICCSSCGTKSKIGNFFATLFLGWWGFPFGLIFTPIYLCKNIYGIVFPVSSVEPTEHLRDFVKQNLALQYIAHAQQEEATSNNGGYDDSQ